MKISKNITKLPMAGAVLSVIAAIGCIIYGNTYSQYADWSVVLALLLGGVLLAVYALVPGGLTEWLSLLGTLCAAWGLGLFFVNSYNVWADTWGNIYMYGKLSGDYNFFSSEGGPIPVIILIVLSLAGVIMGIISCFKGRKEAAE
ncbi:MAG: hypothetical protein LUF00_05310 [Lachnospiraceae bacterium]|nr:hypothetical protein [Lachnospiraceae bacterium]